MELQKRLTELGRIRIGDRVPIASGTNKGKPRPRQLDNFRLTSKNKQLLEEAARIYGGEVKVWGLHVGWEKLPGYKPGDNEYELYTTSNTLNVLVPARQAARTLNEIWKGGECTRRCDPMTNKITKAAGPLTEGMDCVCPQDPVERHEKARKGLACTEVTRIKLFLKDVPGFGTWRLDTMGFYGPAEIRGVLEFLEMAGVTQMIPATLRIEKRKIKSGGETREFVVPILTPLLSVGELYGIGTSDSVKSLMPGNGDSVPDMVTDSLSESGLSMRRHQGKIKEVGEVAYNLGITPEMLKAWLVDRGYEQLADVPETLLDKILTGLNEAGVDMVVQDMPITQRETDA